MLFNSLDFAIFLPVVFILYWFFFNRNLVWQNFLVAVVSYVFYGWWDWRFLFLIFFSTIVDYLVGRKLGTVAKRAHRKILLWISITVNLGFLGFFKYYNFFLDNFKSAFSIAGYELNANTLNIILPVGISFYTFQTLSYTIDVYKNRLEPARDFIAFSAFVSFFPQLVAGPIERATNLLPQFYKSRKFDYSKSVDGMRQILWGLFKKIVIADNCAIYANYIFENSVDLSGSTLLLGAIFFAFQIYGDFSGYSDIAIGTARLFGFDLMQNFAFPYFSRSIAEFWRRWHISLSTWFRDYVYVPLGGSRGGVWMKVRNTFIIFLVSGFWHGANWTFVVWGALNAIYFLPLLLRQKNRVNKDNVVAENSILPNFKELIQVSFTFFLTVIAWVFFRARNIEHAFHYIGDIFSYSFFSIPYYPGIGIAKNLVVLILIFLTVEWFGRKGKHGLSSIIKIKSGIFRKMIYVVIILITVLYGAYGLNQFIYFQF